MCIVVLVLELVSKNRGRELEFENRCWRGNCDVIGRAFLYHSASRSGDFSAEVGILTVSS